MRKQVPHPHSRIAPAESTYIGWLLDQGLTHRQVAKRVKRGVASISKVRRAKPVYDTNSTNAVSFMPITWDAEPTFHGPAFDKLVGRSKHKSIWATLFPWRIK